MDKIKNPVSIFIMLVVFLLSGYQYLDGKYAYAKDVVTLQTRMSLIEIERTYNKALNHYYTYKELSLKYPSDKEVKEELARAKEQLDLVKTQMKKIKDTK